MATPQRTVRHLRLSAPSRAQALSMLPRLEDALRCASLPDDGARLLVVRRLALGRLQPGIETGALSRLIEQRVQAGGGQWVDAELPAAAWADRVVFTSALAARTALARRLLRGEPATAWYWPLAAPEAPPSWSTRDRVRAIAAAVVQWPEAPVALPAWLSALVGDGAGAALAATWSAAEGLALLHGAGLALPAAAAAEGTGVIDGLEGGRPMTRPGTRSPSPGALPVWLLGLLAACPGRPGHAAPAPNALHAPYGLHVPQPVAEPGAGPGPSPVERRARPAPGGAALPMPRPTARPVQTARGDRSPRAPLKPLDVAPAGVDRLVGDATAAAGLLFLLPLLARLGLPAWRAAAGDSAAFVAAVLGLALQRLQIPLDDPIWALAGGPADPAHPLPCGSSSAPAAWQDPRLAPRRQPAGALARQLSDAATGAAQAALWLDACRRWLRRIGGIGLASLVRRPGGLALTTTHVDLHFRLDQTDMRVRRQGLDVDPQWLPWFGRVLAFHYRQGPR